MDKKAINKYYYTQIIKSLATVIGCLYIVQFDDTRTFGYIVGFLSSVMLVSWIRDFVNVRIAMKNGENVEFYYEDEFEDEEEEE